MTANQINAARQREEGRHNLETERQGRDVIQETGRHNREQERIGWGNVGAAYAQVAEQTRHNVATERINWYDVNSNRKLRHSQSSYYRAQAEAVKLNSETNQRNADTRFREALTAQEELRRKREADAETRRHNRVTESMNSYDIRTNRINAETRQDQVAYQNWYQQSQILEQERHNRATERLTERDVANRTTSAVSQVIGTLIGRAGLLGGIGALVGGT